MMVQDNEVCLIRHTYLPGWFLPGGGLKKNETIEQGARREAREETGAELNEIRLLGIFSSFIQWKTDHTAVFLCKDFKITGVSDGEIAEVCLFPLNSIPDNTFASHRKLLEAYRYHGTDCILCFFNSAYVLEITKWKLAFLFLWK